MKNYLKLITFGISLFLTLPFYLLYRLNSLFFGKELAFQGISQFMSIFPGMIGNYMRAGFYFLSLEKCSRDITITFGTLFSTPNCKIGQYVYIGANCMISDSVIEDDVLIGSNVNIISGKHIHDYSNIDVPLRLQKGSVKTIRVGRNSWIGNGAIIMADLGQGCVVGSGSVVTKDIEDYSLAVGNPARVISKRNQDGK